MSSTGDFLPDSPLGVVGAGTMGFSIAACLLMHRHPTIVLATNDNELHSTRERMRNYLRELDCEEHIDLLEVSRDYAALAPCDVVIESVAEDLQIKRHVLAKIEAVIAPEALIASNTSALPISQLQENAFHPERIVGMHWALPAPQSKLMEIVCGLKTAEPAMDRAARYAAGWNKEVAIIRQDVPGFVGNRIMYAMIREACHLVDSDVATPADIDTILRHSIGTWIGFGGLFRYMDLTSGKLYGTVLESLLPHLCNSQEMPTCLQDLKAKDARGVANGRGFFDYTPETARQWEAAFLEYAAEAAQLTEKYFSELQKAE